MSAALWRPARRTRPAFREGPRPVAALHRLVGVPKAACTTDGREAAAGAAAAAADFVGTGDTADLAAAGLGRAAAAGGLHFDEVDRVREGGGAVGAAEALQVVREGKSALATSRQRNRSLTSDRYSSRAMLRLLLLSVPLRCCSYRRRRRRRRRPLLSSSPSEFSSLRVEKPSSLVATCSSATGGRRSANRTGATRSPTPPPTSRTKTTTTTTTATTTTTTVGALTSLAECSRGRRLTTRHTTGRRGEESRSGGLRAPR